MIECLIPISRINLIASPQPVLVLRSSDKPGLELMRQSTSPGVEGVVQ